MRGILLRGPRAIRSLFTEAAASSRPPRIAAAEPSRNHTCVRVQFAPTPNSPISSSSSSAYQVELHRDWITDNSLEHRDAQTSQKTRSIVEVAATREITHVAVSDNDGDTLTVTFSDGTCNTLSGDWLASMFISPMDDTTNTRNDPFDPLKTAIRPKDPVPTISYDAIMSSELGAYDWTRTILEKGLCIVIDAPAAPEVVKGAASRIAPPLNTLYGDSFDVRSEPNPINIAYTDKALRPHMDLAYYESPPGLQFLHCVQFDEDVKGGDSIFYDTFVLAELLRERDSEAFNVLTRIPATFQKDHLDRDDPAQMFYRRPHLSLNSCGDVVAVFWSPAFEGPLQLDDYTAQALGFADKLDAMDAYYCAYRAFAGLMEDPEVMDQWKIKFRSEPGTILAFNQRRMLHGRDAFSSQDRGVRWLQGCYVCIDAFLNRYRTLRLKFARGESGILRGQDAAIRAGNSCLR